MIAPRERRPPALPPARGSAVFVSAAMAIAGSLMTAMMLLWVVLAVAVRRGQRLLAVAVRRGVCLERTWGGQTRGALRGLEGSALEPGGSWHPAHLVRVRRRCSLTVTAARLMRRHVRRGRARPGHETGCMDTRGVCSGIPRCGAASQTGRVSRVARRSRLTGRGGLHYPPANRGRRSAAYPPPLS